MTVDAKSAFCLAFSVLVSRDAAAGVGRHSSVAIGTDGLALISYLDDGQGALKVAHCSNPACTSATLSTVAGPPPGHAGITTADLAVGADGLGLIVYSGPPVLYAAHCSNLECSSATISAVYAWSVSVGAVGEVSQAQGPDGRSLVLFGTANRFSTEVDLAHCSDAPCSTATVTLVSGLPFSDHLPGGIAIGPDGLAVLAFTYYASGPPPPHRNLVVSCMSGPGPYLEGDRAFSVAVGADGLGLVVYTTAGTGLQVAHCTAGPSLGTAVLDASGPIQDATVARGVDGLGLIAYVSGDDLKVAHCSDAACSSATVTVLDSAARVLDNGMAIGADGLGLISYHDLPLEGGGDLKVAHCENVACTSATITILDDTPPRADLIVSLSHTPEPVTGLQSLSYRIWASNLGPDPVSGPKVVQQLPAGAVYRSAVGNDWACSHSGGAVTCMMTAIRGVGSMPEIVVEVSAPPTAQVATTTAIISATVPDPVPANNTATDEATVTAAPLAEVSVVKGDGGAVVHPGLPFTWTITSANEGAIAVSGATVTDTFPPTVSDVTWTCAAAGGATCPAGGTGDIVASVDLPVGGTATFTATGTLGASTYVLTNTATIAPPDGYYDPNPADNTAFVSSQPEPTQAYTLVPCRVVDTRLDPPALGANTTRTFTVAGTCGIPADARAVAVNVTAVNPGEMGDLRVNPAGTAAPLASSVNFVSGRTRAGNAIVALGTAGQVSVQCDMPADSGASVHFVLDVYGYFK
jgi:hypothetical protein